jgi:peroxiredoxin Q/BCP
MTRPLTAGEPMPDLRLLSQEGEPVRLKDFVGKKNLVLFFYPKDHTPICTRQSCAFRDAYTEIRQAGAEVIGISSDDVVSHQSFASKFSLPFALLSDPGQEARRAFGVPKLFGIFPGRSTYVIDKGGVVRFVFTSHFGSHSHVEQALKALSGLRE